MRPIDTTKLDRKSGGSRGTCSFPLSCNNGEGHRAELSPSELKHHSFLPCWLCSRHRLYRQAIAAASSGLPKLPVSE
jgi:hypothetical protein